MSVPCLKQRNRHPDYVMNAMISLSFLSLLKWGQDRLVFYFKISLKLFFRTAVTVLQITDNLAMF